MATRAEVRQLGRAKRRRKRLLRTSCLLAVIVLALVVGGFLVATQLDTAAALLTRLQPPAQGTQQASAANPGAQGTNALHPDEPIPLLVNEHHPLEGDGSVRNLSNLMGIVPVADSSIQVDQRLVEPLTSLFAAARQGGIPEFYVNSAYRSQQRQEELYRESDDKAYVQKPGHSEHQTGLAVDLAVLTLDEGDMGQSVAGQWLAQHAWEYGFILRYPADKEAVTGIPYEPWHFRYVGKQIAQYCFEQGLCLEEYVAAAQVAQGD